MFRKMRRSQQALSGDECIRLLQSERRGVLSVLGDDGYPYGIPLNHVYDQETGSLYFHSSRIGHKMESIRRNDRVSYCVHDQGFRNDGEWAFNVRSVVIFGRIHEIEDEERKRSICTCLAHRFTSDESYIENELKRFLKTVACLELVIEHMTGKLVRES